MLQEDNMKIPVVVVVCPLYIKNISLFACSKCMFYQGIDEEFKDGVICSYKVSPYSLRTA